MKIKSKLIVGFVIIALLILIIVQIALNSSKNIHETFNELEDDIMPGAIVMGNMDVYAQQIKAMTYSYITKNDGLRFEKSGKECLLESIESLEAATATHKAHEIHIGIEELKAAEELELKAQKLSYAALKIVESKDHGADIETLLDDLFENFCPHFKPLVDQIREHKAVHLQELEEAMERVSQIQGLCNKIIFVSCFMILIFAFITGSWISSCINKPLSKFKIGAGMVGKGNIKHRIDIKSNDEFAELAATFNKMTGDLSKSKGELKKYSQGLEKNVQKRTKQLQLRMKELERFNKLMVDRELKMIELKKKIKELENNK